MTETIQPTKMTEKKREFMENPGNLRLANEIAEYIKRVGCPCHDTECFEENGTDNTYTEK